MAGDRCYRNLAAGRCAANPAFDLLNLAEAAFPADGDRGEELLREAAPLGGHFAPLLRADLEDAAGLLLHLDDLLPFVDRQRQRLFAVDVFAGLHRFDGDLAVPVIGSDDRHHFDIFAVEHLAVVFVNFDFQLPPLPAVGPQGAIFSLGGMVRIDIAHRHAVGKVHRLRSDGVPAVAGADAAQDRAVVFAGRRRVLGNEGGGPVKIRHAGRGYRGASFQKITTTVHAR
jgi:hypothetical protein